VSDAPFKKGDRVVVSFEGHGPEADEPGSIVDVRGDWGYEVRLDAVDPDDPGEAVVVLATQSWVWAEE
jgi:hypothetical protein